MKNPWFMGSTARRPELTKNVAKASQQMFCAVSSFRKIICSQKFLGLLRNIFKACRYSFFLADDLNSAPSKAGVRALFYSLISAKCFSVLTSFQETHWNPLAVLVSSRSWLDAWVFWFVVVWNKFNRSASLNHTRRGARICHFLSGRRDADTPS